MRTRSPINCAAVLSYTLGLRHALDADHISAIDLMTRRLIASGQKPVAVGTFFSLGHSTIVIVTCIVVAATSGALRDKFDDFTRVGNIIGTSVSAAFLLILCVGLGRVHAGRGRRVEIIGTGGTGLVVLGDGVQKKVCLGSAVPWVGRAWSRASENIIVRRVLRNLGCLLREGIGLGSPDLCSQLWVSS